jgi:DNA-binding transcriptional regulator YiaG
MQIRKERHMNKQKRKRLEAKGWKTGTVTEFLGLTPEDEAWIEMKRALRDKIVELRTAQRLSQTEFAEKLGTKQPRVSKIESGDKSVGYDLLMKSLLALGATPSEIGAAITQVGRTNGKRSGRPRKTPSPA